MYKLFENLLNAQRLMLVALISCFFISMTSCDGDDTNSDDAGGTEHPYKKEGLIRFYSDGEEFIFTNIIGTAFVKTSSSGIGYDTIGRAYTGYPTLYSIIGSMQFIVLNDSLKLYSFEYRFPTSENVATVFRQTGANADIRPFKFEMEDQDSIMVGSFSGSLSSGIEPDVFVVDSCFFSVQK